MMEFLYKSFDKVVSDYVTNYKLPEAKNSIGKVLDPIVQFLKKYWFITGTSVLIFLKVYFRLSPHAKRRKLLYVLLQRQVEVPEMYPIYVEQSEFCRNIINSLDKEDGGIRLIWGPSGSGKSTYVSRTLSQTNYHIIYPTPRSLDCFPVDGQCGTWLNKALNTPGLLDPDESFPSFICNTLYNEDWMVKLFYRVRFSNYLPIYLDLENRKHAIVLYLDHFENAITLSNKEQLCIYLKKLAEESVRSNRYIVIISCKTAEAAKMIYNINDGVKVLHIGDARKHKWTEKEIEEFFNGASTRYSIPSLKYSDLPENCKISAKTVGTPQQCKDICDALKSGSEVSCDLPDSWAKGWEVASTLNKTF